MCKRMPAFIFHLLLALHPNPLVGLLDTASPAFVLGVALVLEHFGKCSSREARLTICSRFEDNRLLPRGYLFDIS